MTKGEKVLTIICRNIYIISGGIHIFRGRFINLHICCHQSKRGRMLSYRFYEVLISDKELKTIDKKKASWLDMVL